MNPKPDLYTKFLNVEIEEVKPGLARVKTIAPDHSVNFNGVVHGGFIFSVADIAFAYASNAAGKMALALDMCISYRKAAKAGEEIVAVAEEVHKSGKTALYRINVYANQELCAVIQATVYILDKETGLYSL